MTTHTTLNSTYRVLKDRIPNFELYTLKTQFQLPKQKGFEDQTLIHKPSIPKNSNETLNPRVLNQGDPLDRTSNGTLIAEHQTSNPTPQPHK